MKEIHLKKGKVAIVDDEDFDELSKYKWVCHHGYAERSETTAIRVSRVLSMHIQIMGKKDGLEIDHINGNRLDNRRSNLRHVTRRQNNQNRTPIKGCSSEFKGVRWHKGNKAWRSRITIDGKSYNLGAYKSERDAAWVYNVWAESFFGEYARLNILGEDD